MAALITDDMLDVYAITSPWDGVAATLIERYRGVADRVFPYDAGRDLQSPECRERWADIARQVGASAISRPSTVRHRR